MKTYLLMVLVLCSLPGFAVAADVHGGSKLAGYRYFIGYRPLTPTSLEDLPSDIRDKVIEHLKARLGEKFFAEMSFIGGQVVDVNALHHSGRETKTTPADVFSYDLHFQFSRPAIGIVNYEAQIKLRKDGSVFEEINLPAFRQSPEKLQVLSFTQVAASAMRAGYFRRIERAELGYSRDSDEILWRLSYQSEDYTTSGRGLHIEISAHSGKVLRTFESQSVHH